MTTVALPPACMCGSGDFVRAFHYDVAPPGEIRFSFNSDERYCRDVLCCRRCGHCVSVHEMDMSGMYGGDYVSSTYGGGLKCAFDRIVTLPAEQSDNEGRVRRVDAFATEYFGGRSGGGDGRSVLDVGSGLCVFLHRMKASGWQCTALDPDASAAAHARDTVGVDAVHGDFMIANDLGLYDLVTFNKVLEHVVDPIAMLARARKYLKPGGLVYVELPDGEAAAAEGQGREEFFIDHHHVFSGASLAHLVVRAGFILLRMERLREPSTKYTLVAFMAPAGRVHSPTQES